MCAPFKVHPQVHLPAPPKISLPKSLPKDWEKNLAEQIGRVHTQEEFPEIYQAWLKKNPQDLTDGERYEWLQCLSYYVALDTNQNGIPDWSAIVDHQPARILFPQDPDQDGDGVPNVLDPDPLNPQIKASTLPGKIPSHLRIDAKTRPQTARLQEELFQQYGLLAIDHTDRHSPLVLSELLFLLKNAFSKEFVSSLKNLHYVYAFAGHDRDHNIASFHLQAQALSVGGEATYAGENLSPRDKFELRATLAHELGHVVLFEKMTPAELARVAEKFGGWDKLKATDVRDSYFSPAFFSSFGNLPHPMMVSEYAMTNRHEWFAETFAAAVLDKMGAADFKAEEWKIFLASNASSASRSWTNYGNLSSDCRQWLSGLMGPLGRLSALDAPHH
jgi:hypothetical protein